MDYIKNTKPKMCKVMIIQDHNLKAGTNKHFL